MGDVFIVGGLTSIDPKAGIKYHKQWLEGLERFKNETILARTSPEVARAFAFPLGMKEIDPEFFNKYLKDEYIAYMKKDNPDYVLDESERIYIYEPRN